MPAPLRHALSLVAAFGVTVLVLLALGGSLSLGQGVSSLVFEEPSEGPALVLAEDPPVLLEAEAEAPAVGLSLVLPTSNDALLRGDEGAFYSPLDATVPGLRQFGWEGGRYGFVRNVARTPVGPTFTRLHQGVDIRPLYRDRRGEPLDTVRAIADGTVVYANRGAGASSYGRYVVIRHDWDGAPVYSLSAHLEGVWVGPGKEVAAGDPIGRLGYTGTGINRARAHVHLEIALLLNGEFQRWHNATTRGPNQHGIFNGRNLRGVDVASLYLALREDPSLTFREFLLDQPVAYRVAIPGERPLDFLERYPWLSLSGNTSPDRAGAWVVGFTREGVPVEVSRQALPVSRPEVVFVSSEIRQRYLSTGGMLARAGDTHRLTPQGLEYISLLATTPREVPRWN